ncbi:TPA: PqqD family protein [Candidatus Bathyarchaeota archaeon]|nr:PqqD family protein [Candidatus Bathyarchaeota archaeon]
MVFGWIKRRKSKVPPISRSEFLSIRPIKNPTVKWERREGGDILIRIPLAPPKGLSKVLLKMFSVKSREKRIIIPDKVGALVWELCDGKRTVKEISEVLQRRYKMMPVEAELSLNNYFNTLAKRGLLGFILPKEASERLKEALEKGKS